MANNRINDLRSKAWNYLKNQGNTTWKEVCKLTASELEDIIRVNEEAVKDVARMLKNKLVINQIAEYDKDGKMVLKKKISKKRIHSLVAKINDFDLAKIKEMIVEETPEGCSPNFSDENILSYFRIRNSRTIKSKRGTTTMMKVEGCHVIHDGNEYSFSSEKYIPLEKVNDTTNLSEHMTDVSTPTMDMIETCRNLGVKVIAFSPEGMNSPQELAMMYQYGLVDRKTYERFFPIGLSASKARQGGECWLVAVKDWFELETLRAEVLHLSMEEYIELFAKEVVMAKFETGTIGMRTSSVLNISAIEKNHKGTEFLKSIKVEKFDDIKVMSKIDVMMRKTDGPIDNEMTPFTHEFIKDADIELIPSDGSSIMKLITFVGVLHAFGKISTNQYNTFVKIWTESGYDVKVLSENEWMKNFFAGKNWVALLQVRFFGGIKGTVIPVPQMDSDPRCANFDMIAFNKSVKYTSNDAPFEVINFPHLNKAALNYQFCQSTAENAELLIKGAERALKETKKVFSDPAYALRFMGSIRSLNDGLSEDLDDQPTKIANDLEIEPRLLNDVYHYTTIKERLDKYVKGIGFGRIPVNGAYRYVISDPIFLYKKAMGEDFESELKAGQVYVDGIDGYQCGMWRSPMIHFSEPQRADVKNVEYLNIYKDIIILNPYDAIAPSLGGADFDGDKFLTVVDYRDNSFESDLVQAIQMPGYILMDDFGTAPKVPNTIAERIKYYVALSKKARVGQITNWATCVNDMRLNWNKDTREYKWLNIVLMSLRSSQMAEIDSVKTGINADGPKGNLMPEARCNPKKQPLWFSELKKSQGKNSNMEIYPSNSPMQKLYDYTLNFYNTEIVESFKPRGILEVIGESMTAEEIEAFKSIKDIVISYEAYFRREMKHIITLKEKGLIQEEEAEGNTFEDLKNRYCNALNALVQGNVTTDVVAYACYYAANVRADGGKISGRRSFPWFCYYAGMLNLLYRNGRAMQLVALPDREMEEVEIREGVLLIDGEVVKTGLTYPDGLYQIREIEDKPYIMVKRPRPAKVVREEIPDTQLFSFGVSRFTKENQGVNSEELVRRIHENGDVVDIIMDNMGNVNLCIGDIVYGAINNCPIPLLDKSVRIQSHSDLTFIPKSGRASTVMKDEVYAYSQFITFQCTIIKGVKVNTEPTYPEQDGVYSNGSYDEDGYRLDEESWDQYL